ncbi:DUF1028 domain-containing protein [Occultella glacieicola]|uniref:DUF1028 domain-containing protein n=1 Tax=Occultella glacieicola TaxID=2518684 RepID=A0ABY2DYE5_9MICO|nr:DUF1028 domain-containing protein [Occultella glacieicola]TDE89506.1 DUF1028 domain-containing protein [Occultella glacieicola]
MTYTVIALDRGRTAIGIATASRSLAVGATVPALDPRVGAAASQAWTNPRLRGLLLDAVRFGRSPAEATAAVGHWDDEPELRQVAVLALDGRGAAHTGRATTPWRGQVVRDGVIALGNLLTGPEVLEAMLAAFGAPTEPDGAGSLARALLRSLVAGQEAGGDTRGRQSAALLVAEVAAEAVAYDLRVDDDVDPLARLEDLVRLRAAGSTSAP